MRKATVAEVRNQFADLLARVADGQERIGITRHGKFLAVMISLEDFRLLERMEAKIDEFLMATAYAEIREGKGISEEEVNARYNRLGKQKEAALLTR